MLIERKIRLDLLLTERGLAPSRSRARDLIKRGAVRVRGAVVTRPGLELPEGSDLAIAEEWSGYVSRGALKLVAGLDRFGFDPSGRAALDIGASTGGFSQVLLMRGAARVYAVDVGHGQLHAEIRDDPRVLNLEGLDARNLDRERAPEPITAIVADVSFISLAKALPAAFALAAPGAWAVLLVKPQFEAGRDAVGKGGIVKDEAARGEALAAVERFVAGLPGWRPIGSIESPITGQSGNTEYLLGAAYAV
jgi:23S rRNA (cytidine1920-2'-O)/16S rRNA (cytidine1409-2'-O)-methyltransferase